MSVFERYFDGTYGEPASLEERESLIKPLIARISASSSQVLILLDNPSLPFESKKCARRPLLFKLPFECSFPREIFDTKTEAFRAFVYRLTAGVANIKILDSSSLFCGAKTCFAANDNGLLYLGDTNHLNMRGAKMVGQEIMRLYPDLLHAN